MRTTEPTRSRRKPGENRERLLEAGLIEFGLFGYSGTSTASIAARAEVPQPHVYASFSAKRELFLACASRACETVVQKCSGAPAAFACADEVGSIGASDAAQTDSEFLRALLMLLQAFSAVRDTELRVELAPRLRELRGSLGAPLLAHLLGIAAESQLLEVAADLDPRQQERGEQ